MEKTAIIDFNGTLNKLSSKCLHYVDLSPKGCYKEALSNLYLKLRECEVVKEVNLILVNYQESGYEEGTLGSTLFDKIYRSGAGVQLAYNPESETGDIFEYPKLEQNDN